MSGSSWRHLTVCMACAWIVITGCTKADKDAPSPGSSHAIVRSEAFNWKEAAPADAGIDEALLKKIDVAAAEKHSKTYSLLIVKEGRLVFERY
jgi:hypothetical protein